jgi:hypothetical protein
MCTRRGCTEAISIKGGNHEQTRLWLIRGGRIFPPNWFGNGGRK